MKHALAFLAFTLVPISALGAGWGNPSPITILSVLTTRTLIYQEEPLNPDGCDAASPAALPTGTGNYSTMNATLLAAFLAGKEVRLHFSGCIDLGGTTYPQVDNVQLRQ